MRGCCDYEDDIISYPRNHRWDYGNLYFEANSYFHYFDGNSFDEDYLDWEIMVDEFFACNNVPLKLQARIVASKLIGRAKVWWKQLKHARRLEGRKDIQSWSRMKRLMRDQFIFSDFDNLLCYNSFYKSEQAENERKLDGAPLFSIGVENSVENNIIDEALGDVARHIENGMTCSYIADELIVDLKHQIFENEGIKGVKESFDKVNTMDEVENEALGTYDVEGSDTDVDDKDIEDKDPTLNMGVVLAEEKIDKEMPPGKRKFEEDDGKQRIFIMNYQYHEYQKLVGEDILLSHNFYIHNVKNMEMERRVFEPSCHKYNKKFLQEKVSKLVQRLLIRHGFNTYVVAALIRLKEKLFLQRRICSSRDKSKTWDLLLAQMEFAFNSMVNRSTGKAAFAIVYTHVPKAVVDLHDLPPGVTHKSAEDLVEHISQIHKVAKEKLEVANVRYKEIVDRHRRFRTFEEGELVMVYLSKERYPTGTYNKLKAKKVGSYHILHKINEKSDEWKISWTFNVKDIFDYYPPDAVDALHPYSTESSSSEEWEN